MRRMHGTSLGFALIVIILSIFIFTSGCTGTAPAQKNTGKTPVSEDPVTASSWKTMQLADLQGRGNISISGFSGKTVIIPVVSVSCSSCIVQLVRQLEEIDRFAKGNPGQMVVVSLDIDPDSGPGFITSYGTTQNLAGYAVRSPPEMTMQVFRRFGPFAVDTQTIPVILVCPDGHDLLLPPGLKTAGMLNETITREC
jgi:hypothetical protein